MRRTLVTGAQIAAAWALAGVIVVATLAPQSLRPHLADPQVERFAAYFLVGLLFSIAYPGRLRLIALGVVAGAVGLELLQVLAPGRDAGATDALAKCLGGLIAVSLVAILRATSQRKSGAAPDPERGAS